MALALRARRLVQCGAQSLGKLQCIVVGPEMQEEESRLLVQHVAVDRSHVDAVRPQRLDHGIHFVIGENEVTGNRALPPPVGWKLIAMATPIGPTGAICIPSSMIGSRRGTLNW